MGARAQRAVSSDGATHEWNEIADRVMGSRRISTCGQPLRASATLRLRASSSQPWGTASPFARPAKSDGPRIARMTRMHKLFAGQVIDRHGTNRRRWRPIIQQDEGGWRVELLSPRSERAPPRRVSHVRPWLRSVPPRERAGNHPWTGHGHPCLIPTPYSGSIPQMLTIAKSNQII